ncbi:MAG: prefoldin subunit alpha [archaeon]
MESDKELFFKMNMLDQYMKNMQQQIEVVENEIRELSLLKKDLEELKNSSGKEIFSSVGKNIFIKAKIISEELLMNIGEETLVKKSIPETAKIMEKQIEKLKIVKKEILSEIDNLNEEARKLLSSMNQKTN